MKRFTEMTNTEIIEAANDPATVANLIDLECAHEGIELLPAHPGTEPKVVKLPCDLKIFSVAGMDFMTPEAAGRVLTAITQEEIFKRGYNSKVVEPLKISDYSYPKVETSEGFSPEIAAKNKLDPDGIKQQHKDWVVLDKKYQDISSERSSIDTDFWDKVRFAQSLQRGIETVQANYRRYLDLAGGDINIAITFLLDACKDESLIVENLQLIYVDENGDKHLTNIERIDPVGGFDEVEAPDAGEVEDA